jgi:hypothetical protein
MQLLTTVIKHSWIIVGGKRSTLDFAMQREVVMKNGWTIAF